MLIFIVSTWRDEGLACCGDATSQGPLNLFRSIRPFFFVRAHKDAVGFRKLRSIDYDVVNGTGSPQPYRLAWSTGSRRAFQFFGHLKRCPALVAVCFGRMLRVRPQLKVVTLGGLPHLATNNSPPNRLTTFRGKCNVRHDRWMSRLRCYNVGWG